MNKLISSKLKKRAVAVAVASCLAFAPWAVQAAGLGKITVLSGLGQPLRAELEVSATREEMVGMAARLAPVDAFRQAGVDYVSVLSDLRFAVDKRSDGKSVVKITSAKPVNEPFLDFLVELNWSSGRLIREYTFLLDPPDIASNTAGRPLSVVEAKPVKSVPGGTTPIEVPAPKAVEAPPKPAVKPAPLAVPKSEEVPKVDESRKPVDKGETHLTKSGDTLGKIASAKLHEGVSLEQMLVGLYQKNPEAFIGKNLNRLKSGAILSIPEKAEVEAIPEAEAKKVLLTQSGDWNAYRQKLASAVSKVPAREEVDSQQTGGKVTAKVEEKTLPSEKAKDQVKVSRTEQAAKPAGVAGLSEEDRIAKDRALKEAGERVALLEKNVSELQKLVDLKNQKLAELQQQSVAKPEEVKTPPVAAVKEEVKPAVEPPKVEEAAPAKPLEAAPAPAPAPATEPKPPVKPAPPPPPPPPVAEPDFVESLLSDPATLAGGGGILALLMGYLLYKRRRTVAPVQPSTMAVMPSGLGESSVFRDAGGQSVDTRNTAPHTGEFSQAGPGTIDTGDVDPVSEADVYIAYGRDAQAEEILLEALQRDPQRLAIHVKLLEIYAARESLKQFETLASELYAQTAGVGPEWAKIATMGARLDPANPLYGNAGSDATSSQMPVFDADATMVVSPSRAPASAAVDVAFELPAIDEDSSLDSVLDSEKTFTSTVVKEPLPAVEELPEEIVTADELTGLDFDLGTSIVNPPPVAEPVVVEESADDALDFDLGMTAAETPRAVQKETLAEEIEIELGLPSELEQETPDFSPEGTLVMSNPMDMISETIDMPEVASPEESMVDFELDMGTETAPEPMINVQEKPAEPKVDVAVEPAEPVAMDDIDADSLEFDMKLTDSTVLGQPMSPPSFDISSINLDLAADEAAVEASAPVAPPVAEPKHEEVTAVPQPSSNAAVDAAVREEINTKLDLAKAYEEMGDLEGARELLAEVAAEGPPDLAGEAKEILARIG